MRRPTHTSHSWRLNADDPVAIPNARIVLALMHCVRRLPGALRHHDFDDVGGVLAPVFEDLRTPLRAAIKKHVHAAAAMGRQTDGFDLDPELNLSNACLLSDRHVLTLLGAALSRATPCFRSLFDKAEAKLTAFVDKHPHPSDQNIDILSNMLGLSAPEVAYLRLATAFCYGTVTRSNFAFVNSLPRQLKAVEKLCDVSGSAAMRMFDSDRPLIHAGLFEPFNSRRSTRDLEDNLCLTSIGARLLSTPVAGPGEMAAMVLTPLPPQASATTLEWPHLQAAQTLLAAALTQALAQRLPGFNVLLHGAPGTGKTEYARQVIAEIGAAGFAIDHVDESGDEARRSDRLASLRLSQTFAMQRERAVLVLDEAEDIFQGDHNHPLSKLFKRETESKAWTNNLLETNAHPVIWISNEVRHLDPAYLRRFTFCLEFPPTPQALRRKISEEQLSAVGCSRETIDAVSALTHVAPALLATAVKFSALSAASGLGPDLAIRTLLDQHARAAGQTLPPLQAKRVTRFDMRYLNVEGTATPPMLLQALHAEGAATLLFSGPPGTGKTQFAAEIASQLGRQLVVRTASDINTKWYGESEANVARMFRECDPKSELLFLDEAEVLLGARDAATHRADRAVTAEFLRWLEAFEGIFVCATNHRTDFDAALMRRFTFRLEFKPLDRHQREALYAELALEISPTQGDVVTGLDAATAARLSRLELLTPGDFANVARRTRSLGLDATHWIAELEAEHQVKGGASRARMGFV